MNPSIDASDDVHSLRGVQASFLRPLSAIAATRAGAVPQTRITRILTDLAGPLSVLHGSGRIHGAISCDSIGLDAQGRADIILPPLYDAHGARDQALQAGRASGFNAFEQFTDDPAWKTGPWTDVYALCAACFRLVTGTLPPAAIDRCLADRYVPLVDRGVKGYDRRFLTALDQGLSLRPQERPTSIAQLLIATGMEAGAAYRLCRLDGPVREDGGPAAVLPTSTYGPAPAATPGTSSTHICGAADPYPVLERMTHTKSGFAERTPEAPFDRSLATQGMTGEQWRLTGETSSWLASSAWLSWVIIPVAVAFALFGVWLVCQHL